MNFNEYKKKWLLRNPPFKLSHTDEWVTCRSIQLRCALFAVVGIEFKCFYTAITMFYEFHTILTHYHLHIINKQIKEKKNLQQQWLVQYCSWILKMKIDN